ncbi:MAG TPA: phosphoribosylformylglycinamidine synthase subunit PurL [Pirellulales bacterium]|jgi:phosphoribosylformylglycinamidine synthase II|nr:phosphoribosylformylglycinamidine synthase subunit PurL [Pirellulales bacterium]
MLWEVDVHPAPGQPNRAAERVVAEAAELGLATDLAVAAAHGFLIEGDLGHEQIERLARELLSDRVVETTVSMPARDPRLVVSPDGTNGTLLHVLLKPGVMDPVAQSTLAAIGDFGFAATAVRTLRKYWIAGLDDGQLRQLASKVLANDAIEQVIFGPLPFDRIELGSEYRFALVTVPIRDLDDAALVKLSREGQLYLSIAEMRTIQSHFRELGRDPTDAELETLAQTWSEHCSHKTLGGRVVYRGPDGERRFENMLKETIFAATAKIRQQLGDDDWCVSVFKDNAGVVRFDDKYNVCFKVETHNHPSALEPYGGANTGVGGVIRDTLGTGLGAKPICSTDVFCFAPPDTPADSLPSGVLHPQRVMKGVVAGVRDYGNRMGIPTVNGAIYFDPRYLGNPLVYCGNVGLIPRDKSHKQPRAGDHIVAIGGRTGRDGIHGATFSSAELTSQSETLSGGAVQIGNAITEKMVLDAVLRARDRGLFHAITDCGAGGFSSAVGEMGEEIGAEVWLDRAPLKYDGLSYTEIWISEAQERMVLSVGPDQWDEFRAICAEESVEATIIGRFVPTGRLKLSYNGHQVADLSMQFLHGGRPPVVREATYSPAPEVALRWHAQSAATGVVDSATPFPDSGRATQKMFTAQSLDCNDALVKILGSLNVCSKEWVIRQYDHEVQGGSVIKPLAGATNDGPSDAAVLRPVLGSHRGLAISCGMNPRYGDYDTYHMAASAIDEAIRNCVAVGADPERIAILDNFCWGDCERAETFGSLVRAAIACHDVALALGTPFISGKDSLNNEFRFSDSAGAKQTIAIPPSLLISAMGQIDDVRQCVTMDLKEAGNVLYLVGETHDELAGSQLALVAGLSGGRVPRVNPPRAKATFTAIHRAIQAGYVRACHDLSEGGLAVALAEMAFAGAMGAQAYLGQVRHSLDSKQFADRPGLLDTVLLFSESNSRFVCEVPADEVQHFEKLIGDVPHAAIGEVTAGRQLQITGTNTNNPDHPINLPIDEMKEAWQKPLWW